MHIWIPWIQQKHLCSWTPKWSNSEKQVVENKPCLFPLRIVWTLFSPLPILARVPNGFSPPSLTFPWIWDHPNRRSSPPTSFFGHHVHLHDVQFHRPSYLRDHWQSIRPVSPLLSQWRGDTWSLNCSRIPLGWHAPSLVLPPWRNCVAVWPVFCWNKGFHSWESQLVQKSHSNTKFLWRREYG